VRNMQNVRFLYAFRFFHNLIPAYVIERLFWEQRGMSIPLVVLTEIIYALTVILLEVPSGIAADKFGRKRMMVVAGFFGCCEFLILVFAAKFWHFAAAVFVAGIGRAASSGAETALLYDSLLVCGEEHKFEKCLGRLNAWDFTAAIIAALSGSVMASLYGFELNYWVSVGGMLVSLAFSFMLVEPERKSLERSKVEAETEEPLAFWQYVTASLRFFRKQPDVSLMVLAGMVVGASVNYIDEFWQLYVNRLGVPVVFFGVFSAGLSFIRLPGNMLAYKLKDRISYRTLITSVLTMFTAGSLYLALVKGYSSLVVIFTICGVSGIIDPLVSGYLHHRIDSTMRATIDSFQSLGLRAVTMLVGLGFGYFSSVYDIFGGYGFIALVCLAYLVYFMRAHRTLDGNLSTTG
jgi:MFS family permease